MKHAATFSSIFEVNKEFNVAQLLVKAEYFYRCNLISCSSVSSQRDHAPTVGV